MAKSRTAKIILWTAGGIAVVVALLAVLSTYASFGIPTRQRIGEFTGGDLAITLCPEHNPPYHFVLGVPGKPGTLPIFCGSLEITFPDGTQRTFPLRSETTEPCNWIEDSDTSGYVFAWNEPQCFSDLLRPGTTYLVRFAFSEPIPAGCSLWFSSSRHASLLAP